MLTRLARFALWIPSVLAWGFLTLVGVRHFLFPLELGYGESLLLQESTRAATGQAFYAAPSLHYIPLAYMPGAMLLVAPLVRWFGPQLWEGRLVTGVPAFLLAALIVLAIRRATKNWSLAAAGGALWLMGQGMSGIDYVHFRPDPLMLLLTFLAMAALRFGTGNRSAVAAAALVAAGFFTKQQALLIGAAALPHLALNDRRRFVVYAVALVAFCGGGFLLLSWWLGPWFRFYVFDVPRHWTHPSVARVGIYLLHTLLGHLELLTLPAMVWTFQPHRPWRDPDGLWLWVAFGGIATGLLATLDPYAARHTLLPTIACLALAGPIAIDRVTRQLQETPAPWIARAAPAAACLLLIAQFYRERFQFQRHVPPRVAASDARALIERIWALPGPVLMPGHGYYAYVAGKGTSLSILALDDVVRSRGNPLLARDPGYMDRMFDALRHGPGRPTIILSSPLEKAGDVARPLWASLLGPYRRAPELETLTAGLEGAFPAGEPCYLYVPVDSAAAAVPAGASRRTAR